MKSKSLIIMSLVLCGTLAAAFNPNENLIAHWRLDETTGSTGYNSMPNVDLRLINTTDNSHWVDGKFGRGVNFGGSIVGTPDTTVWTITDLGGFQEKAISMWVKFDDISDVQYFFVTNWSHPEFIGYRAAALNVGGHFRMQYGDKADVPDNHVHVNNVFEADKWYHIVLLSRNTPDDLSQMETWINGELIASKSGLRRDDSIRMNSVGIGGGAPQVGGNAMLKGIMDDVRVYDKGLTQEDISALYEYQPQEPFDSLMVYLPMDEHVSGWVHDEMGLLGGEVWVGPARYQNDLTGSTWNKNGKFGGCFTGNGQMSRIPLAHSPIDGSTEALGVFQNKTVSAWIRPNAVTAPNGNIVQYIFSLVNRDPDGQPYRFYVLLNNGAVRIQGTEGNNQWTLPVIDGQTWYHIAVVNTNTPDGLSELKLYVNGDYKISRTGIVRDQLGKHYYPSIGATGATEGRANTEEWRSFYGSIDDFRIYDAALTDTQVADLAGFTPEPKKFDHKRNLELYWQFDQNGGDNLIIDSSGNDLYGVMNNYDGNSAQWVNGVFGKAFNFDGSTNSIIFANRQNEFAFGPFKSKTISAWIKPNATSGIQSIATIVPQDDLKFYFYVQGAYLRVQGFKYDSGDVTLEVPGITAGEWTHVAAVIREYSDLSHSVCFQGIDFKEVMVVAKKLYPKILM